LTASYSYATIYYKSNHFIEIKRYSFLCRPATHPIYFAAVSPDKIIAALRGRYFSFSQIKSYEPSERDTGFPANAAAKQGQELRSV